jgi:soluble lytic murein transglycosylase
MIPEQAANRWLKRALVCVAGLMLLAGGPALAADDSEQQLTDALRSMGKDDWQWAKRTIDRLGNRQLSLYARWRELLESADKPSFRTYAAFLREHPDWPSLGTIQARAEEQIDEAVSHEERLAFFARLKPSTRQGRVRYAQALLGTGKRNEAVAVLRRSWAEDDVPLAEERYFLGLYGDYLRPEDHEARLDRLLWDREIGAAQRMLPFTRAERDTVAVARIRLQGLEKKAEATVAGLPKGARVDPGVLYDEVRFYRRRGKHAQANALLARPPADLVRPELWWSEQNTAIRELIDDGEFVPAYRIARAHRQDDGTAFAEGEWLAGWLALRFLKQPGDAAKHFERLWEGVSSPISRGRAGYWAGRAYEAAGNKAGAREWYGRAARYPTSFYGQLAADKLDLKLGALLAPRTRASAAAKEQLRRREPAAVARALCTLGDRTLAQPFFRHLGHTAARNADALRAVVELGEECRRPDLMVIATKAAVREGGSDADPHGSFPTPALRNLRTPDVALAEPPLRLAVARQESQFDPRVASPAGALGLMQLMPATAQAMAARLKLPYSKPRLTRDPEYNARIGSFYLRQQLARFDDAPALALAAYNAGPSRVNTWLGEHGDPRGKSVETLVDWIERIPFGETRNYVQRVLEAREIYDVLLRRENGSVRQADASPAPREPNS